MSESITSFVNDRGSPIVSVAVSSDGKYIATARQDKRVELRSSRGVLLSSHRDHKKGIELITISDDGSFVVTQSAPGCTSMGQELIIWNTKQSQTTILPPAQYIEYYRSPVLLSEMNLLAVDNCGLLFFDTKTAREVKLTIPKRVSCELLASSPDGKLLALATKRGQIVIWDMEKKRTVCRLKGHRDSVDKLAFSDDGDKLASTSYDDTFRIWDVLSGTELLCVKTPCKELFHLAYLSCRDAWLVIDRGHGFREISHANQEVENIMLPRKSTVSAVTSCQQTDQLVIGRSTGRVETWSLSDLLQNEMSLNVS